MEKSFFLIWFTLVGNEFVTNLFDLFFCPRNIDLIITDNHCLSVFRRGCYLFYLKIFADQIIHIPEMISQIFCHNRLCVPMGDHSGMFRAMQLAAANALEAEQEWYDGNNKNYRNRRHLAGEIMHALGCTYDEKQVGMFLWGKIPDSCADVEELTEKVLHNARVFITPGFIFGSNGKRYIRISLCCKDHKLEEALKRIREMK